MQVMPDTYEDLQQQNNLGPDPFNPEDNILAGTAYIKEMYARYGAPGFLAAYNAGPEALDDYLAGNGDLPDETVNYLAAVAPNLGDSEPMTGPLASYATGIEAVASAQPVSTPSASSFALGCDVNAAYDPGHPCAAAQSLPATQLVAAVQSGAGACDTDTAYDPDNPCTSAPDGTGSCDADRAYDPDSPCTPVNQPPATADVETSEPSVMPPSPNLAAGTSLYMPTAPSQPAPLPPQATAAASAPAAIGGAWAVQVGAFSNPGLARAVAEGARAEASAQLANATIALPATPPFGGLILYSARLTNLSANAAAQACATLNSHQLPCIVLAASSG
jgi:D-alanyl-D-alanine carboxypeptidase